MYTFKIEIWLKEREKDKEYSFRNEESESIKIKITTNWIKLDKKNIKTNNSLKILK